MVTKADTVETNGTGNKAAAEAALEAVAQDSGSQQPQVSIEDTLLLGGKGKPDLLQQFTTGPETAAELFVRAIASDEEIDTYVQGLSHIRRIVAGSSDPEKTIESRLFFSMSKRQGDIIRAYAGTLGQSMMRPLRKGIRGSLARARTLENREIE